MARGEMEKLWRKYPYLWAIQQNWMSGIISVSEKTLDGSALLSTVMKKGEHVVWLHRRLETDVQQDRVDKLSFPGTHVLLIDVLSATCEAQRNREEQIDAVIVHHLARHTPSGDKELIVVYKRPRKHSISELVCKVALEIEHIRTLPERLA